MPDIIIFANFGVEKLRGLRNTRGQILEFPIEMAGHPYNRAGATAQPVIYEAIVAAIGRRDDRRDRLLVYSPRLCKWAPVTAERLAEIFLLCYYAIDEVILFTLKMESNDDNANVNLWNYLKDIRHCEKLITSFELQLESYKSYIIMAVWALEIKRIFDWYNLHSGDDSQTGCLNDRGDRRRNSRFVYPVQPTGRGDWRGDDIGDYRLV